MIGKNTVECLQSGVLYGFAGQVDGLVRRIVAELGAGPVTVLGHRRAGPAHGRRSRRRSPRDVPDLTLLGLRLAYLRNAGSGPTPARRPATVPCAAPSDAPDRTPSPSTVPAGHGLTREHRAARTRPPGRLSRADAGPPGEAGRLLDAGIDPYPVAVPRTAHARARSAPPIRTCRRTPRPATGSASPAG